MMDAQQLIEAFGYWAAHPQYPVEDWKYEVANDDTRQDYWTWVASKLNQDT